MEIRFELGFYESENESGANWNRPDCSNVELRVVVDQKAT